MEAIATRLEAIASRLEAIASRLEAIASRVETIASRVETIASSSSLFRQPFSDLSRPHTPSSQQRSLLTGCRDHNGQLSQQHSRQRHHGCWVEQLKIEIKMISFHDVINYLVRSLSPFKPDCKESWKDEQPVCGTIASSAWCPTTVVQLFAKMLTGDGNDAELLY